MVIMNSAGILSFAQVQIAEPAFAFGSPGAGPGEFNAPRGVAVAPDGNVLVSDALNNKVQIFTWDGAYVSEFGYPGTALDAMNTPLDLAVHTDGNIFVLDSYNHRVQKFDPDRNIVTVWGGLGSATGEFNLPRCLALDRESNVYVSDGYNNRVQKFTADGVFLLSFGGDGSTDGKMRVPVGIVVDNQTNVYVADQGNYRIQKFTSTGKFITEWGKKGSQAGEFQNAPNADGGPNDMAIDLAGNVVVADAGNNRIQVFTSSGQFITEFGSLGSELGQMNLPGRLTFGPGGVLYVTDIGNIRIQAFNYTTPLILTIKCDGDNASLSWTSIPGRTYQLQFKRSLNDANWTNLGGEVVPTNNLSTATISVSSELQQFLRVAVVN